VEFDRKSVQRLLANVSLLMAVRTIKLLESVAPALHLGSIDSVLRAQ
jgi:hypothetical protein